MDAEGKSLAPQNATALDRLCRALDFAEGFALFFARCNLPAQRDDLLARLSTRMGKLNHQVSRLDIRPDESLIARLLEIAVTLPPGGSVHICGLEHHMPADEAHPPVLSRLNLAREHLRKLPCPVVFWLRDHALTRMAQGAPDLWAWRSGVFEFIPDPAWAAQVYHQPRGGMLEWQGLPPEEKRQRLLTLEGLLDDYRELGNKVVERNILAELLLELGLLYTDNFEMEVAINHLTEALSLYQEIDSNAARLGEANVLKAIGDVYSFRKELDAALESYRRALILFQSKGSKLGEANTLKAIGDTQRFRDENNAARESYEQALALFRATGSKLGEANTLKTIGDILHFRTENDVALENYEQALVLFRAVGSKLGEANTLQAIGDILSSRQENNAALECYERALILFKAASARLGEANVLSAIGDVLFSRQESNAALECYEQASVLFRETGDRLGEANILQNIANIYLTLGKTEEAMTFYNNALNLYQQIGSRAGTVNTYWNMGIALAQNGQVTEAEPLLAQAVDLGQTFAPEHTVTTYHKQVLEQIRGQLTKKGASDYFPFLEHA